MDYGFLSSYFEGFGTKRLSDVELPNHISNQHELNGINEFKELLGSERKIFDTKFVYLSDDEEKTISSSGSMTWYDARENHATRTEFRLYYSANDILLEAAVGDLIVVCKVDSHKLLVIVAPKGSTSEKQLMWLFGFGEIGRKLLVRDLSGEKKQLGFAGKYIIESLGIEIRETVPDILDELLVTFGHKFPTTKEFSEYARGKLKDISAIDDPDYAIIAWLDLEEKLFKTLEKEIVRSRLKQGFGVEGNDIDAFINFSLSVQNRRKSRAGHAFENHLSALFITNQIRFSKGQVTERNNKPDFIFPSINDYHNSAFDSVYLTMLGVKTTAKDRWRQVLSEADKIQSKHLITLQPAISENQTEEMKAQKLQLVVPSPIMTTYSEKQRNSMLSLSDFIQLVRDRQESAFS